MKNLLTKVVNNKKAMALTLAMCMCFAFGCTCFAASGDLASQLDFTPIISAITDKISPTDIIIVIAAVVGAGMSFVLAWFGIRKVINYLRNAIKSGKLKG